MQEEDRNDRKNNQWNTVYNFFTFSRRHHSGQSPMHVRRTGIIVCSSIVRPVRSRYTAQQHSSIRSIDRSVLTPQLWVMEKFCKPLISHQLNQEQKAHKQSRALQRTPSCRKIPETLTVITS